MSVSAKQIEILKQKIMSAFANVPYPINEIALHECDECREIRKTFANRDWKTIEPMILEQNYDAIPLFSPEAFHFFLPAYLVYSLNKLERKDGKVMEFTTYAVTPDKNIEENVDYWRKKFENFTLKQFSLIYDFLDIARECEEFNGFIANIKKGKERLKNFIEPTLKN